MTENSGNTDIILSKTMKITCTDQDSNVLLVGGSGPGISSYIASNMLQAREVYVAADPGGSLYRQYGGFLKDMGYRVKCLDLIDFAENRYNPFKCRYPLSIYTKIFLDGRAGLPGLNGILFKGGKRRLSVSVAVRDAEQLKEACGGIWEEISKVFDAMIFLSDGQTIKRSFITLAFDDRRLPSRSNGASDSEDDRSHWVDEMFCGLAEDECLVAVFTRGVGTARKDRRYVVSEHPNWSIAEQSMQENS